MAILCAAPLFAASDATSTIRGVVAPCQRTTAQLTVSAGSATQPRQYTVSVANLSSRPIRIPRSPIFGWRIETRERGGWRLKAEGGPIRRLGDAHFAVVADTQNGSDLLEVAPAATIHWMHSIPELDPLLVPDQPTATIRLTLLWAPSPALIRSNRTVPPCALAPEWVAAMQKSPAK